jgi:uncharacterized protein (DUF1015 family)
MRIKPFRALRPRPELAASVASVPYDVVNRAEAAALAEGNPHSFLHVGRSDIDLPADTDPYDSRIYAGAKAALDRLVTEGTLVRDRTPALFLYRLTMDGRSADRRGGMCARGRLRARSDPEAREDQEGQGRRPHPARADVECQCGAGVPHVPHGPGSGPAGGSCGPRVHLYDFTAPDGVRHTVWKIADPKPWMHAFGAVPLAYVADGPPSLSQRVAGRAGAPGQEPGHTGDEEYNWFLAVLFPRDQLRILPYNRLVKDLNA